MRMRFITALAGALLLAGCGSGPQTVPFEPREQSVNPAAAAELVNRHRAARGRPPVSVDPVLTRVAAATAQELARRNTVSTEKHTADGLRTRLEEAGYSPARAAENLAGGNPTLASVMKGWEGSRRHNRNLLLRDVTQMGIGLAVTGEGELQSFWVLILAAPEADA